MTAKIIEIIEKLNSAPHNFPLAHTGKPVVSELRMRHRCPLLNAGACSRPVQCVTSILCFVLWPHVTADWKLGALVLSSVISQAKLFEIHGDRGESYLVTPTLPSPVPCAVCCLSLLPPVSLWPLTGGFLVLLPVVLIPFYQKFEVVHGKQLHGVITGLLFRVLCWTWPF